MIDETPKKLLLWNRGKDTIRIKYFRFQSTTRPRELDVNGEKISLQENETYTVPIVGEGDIFMMWHSGVTERADHFAVQFDSTGEPYPYIFGGNKWTRALRHAAFKATDPELDEGQQ